MHILRACWCSLFLFCLRRYFCLDTCLSHRISFFAFGTQKHSCLNPLYIRHGVFRFHALDFTTLALSINFARIMKNQYCNAINLIMQQNKMHKCICKGIKIVKDSNGISGPYDFWFINSKWGGFTKGKGKIAQWTFEILYAKQAVDSIPKEPFSRCFQSFSSICQTLLFTN